MLLELQMHYCECFRKKWIDGTLLYKSIIIYKKILTFIYHKSKRVIELLERIRTYMDIFESVNFEAKA